MSRKLASIQKIKKILPHTNSDNLELAIVQGWQCVVKKGEFKEGQWIVYCEIDSILPQTPWSEFLRRLNFRIKTIKLRGELSQGLVLPMNVLPEQGIVSKDGVVGINYAIGEDEDVTEVLGVTKYEPPVPANLGGDSKGLFPSFIPKTDETRIQSMAWLLEKYEGVPFYITEKNEGSSATFYWKDGAFGVCSRNMELKETEGNSFWAFARETNMEERLRTLNRNVAIQGELIGNGIQGNIYGLKGRTVKFFNVFDIDERRYLDFEEFKYMIEKWLGYETVPVLEVNHILRNDLEFYIKDADGMKSQLADVLAEGKVYRPMKEIHDPKIGRVSFKVINNTYLLGEK